MTSGELARAAGVGLQTVRFYERRGLLPDPPRSRAGRRQYADADLQRVRFIRHAQDLGFRTRKRITD
ncbi:MAG: MerR family transcriptional regulator [Gemmatimonadota bacterium]